jgi:hypothetical protein
MVLCLRLGVHEWIILKRIFEQWDEGVDWIALAKYTDTWLAFVKAVLNFRVP